MVTGLARANRTPRTLLVRNSWDAEIIVHFLPHVVKILNTARLPPTLLVACLGSDLNGALTKMTMCNFIRGAHRSFW